MSPYIAQTTVVWDASVNGWEEVIIGPAAAADDGEVSRETTYQAIGTAE